jgi:SAM-dependent methyltransferase
MNEPGAEINRQTYGAQETVAHYAALNYLSPCERLLFETYIKRASAVLDLGVGGGRTTPFLAQRASRYLGVDFVPAMIESCRRKFPELEFAVASAVDLSFLPDASFDAVVFSFNGIDFIHPDAARWSCLQHICRVLKPGGIVILSSHNPRAIVVRPSWNRDRLWRMATRLTTGLPILAASCLAILTAMRAPLAWVQALGKTTMRVVERAFTRMFWRGEGCLLDSAHGGLYTHCWTPARAVAAMESLPLVCERILGDDYPKRSHPLATDWYYYVFAKPNSSPTIK